MFSSHRTDKVPNKREETPEAGGVSRKPSNGSFLLTLRSGSDTIVRTLTRLNRGVHYPVLQFGTVTPDEVA